MSVKVLSSTESVLAELGDKSVIFFSAEWHEPSKTGGQMDTVFSLLSTQYPGITFIKVDAESLATLSEKYQVSVVPSFILLQRQNLYLKVEGVDPPLLNKEIGKLSDMPPLPEEV